MKKCFIISFILFSLSVTAFERTTIISSLANGEVINLGQYTCTTMPGDYSSCLGITVYSGFVYDPQHHKLLQFGGGHASTMRDDVNVFHFDSLLWKSAYQSTQCSEMTLDNFDTVTGAWKTTGHPHSRHTYDMLNYADTLGELLLMETGHALYTTCANGTFPIVHGRIGHYNPSTGKWRYSKAAAQWERYAASEYDPVSGRVIIVHTNGVWLYDPVSETISKLSAEGGPGIENTLVYYPPTDKFYHIATSWVASFTVTEFTINRSTWTLTSRTLSGMTGDFPVWSNGNAERGFVYDKVNQRIGGGISNGFYYSFDPRIGVWSKSSVTVPGLTVTPSVIAHSIAYDTVNKVVIFQIDLNYKRYSIAYRPPTLYPTSNESVFHTPVSGFTLYPNPSHSPILRVNGKDGWIPELLTIYDLQGRLVTTMKSATPGIWQPSHLTDGTYIVSYKFANRICKHKLIILK
ncbi:MAG: T9SS type A sorting domain-containing protein [Fibrobacteres bacterium]|nr:T9SS type A sorting domain-containing protein [Fibrobacterota bacterium]